MTWPTQCFVMSNEAIEAMQLPEVLATADVMRELGIFQSPFPEYAVVVNGKHFIDLGKGDWDGIGGKDAAREQIKTYDMKVHFREKPGEDSFGVRMWVDTHDGHGWTNVSDMYSFGQIVEAMNCIKMYLIVLLATRNIDKRVAEDKLVKLGIGARSGKRYRYTTTISIGKVEEDDGHEARHTGIRLCPHLRRGHVRRQRYGHAFQFEKKVFIQPVFVNADPNWTPEVARDHYNVAL